jgi:hypothetical protein
MVHLNGILHKSLSSICLYVYSLVVARQRLSKSVSHWRFSMAIRERQGSQPVYLNNYPCLVQDGTVRDRVRSLLGPMGLEAPDRRLQWRLAAATIPGGVLPVFLYVARSSRTSINSRQDGARHPLSRSDFQCKAMYGTTRYGGPLYSLRLETTGG